MEKPPLEKIIEKLEQLDARAWKLETDYCFITKVSGLTVHVFKFEDLERTRYKLELVDDDGYQRVSYTSYNAEEKDMLEGFYKNISQKYHQVKEEEFKEMINNLLTD